MVHSIFPVAASDRRLRTLSQLCSPLQQPIVTQDDVRKTIFSSPSQESTISKHTYKSVDMQSQASHSLHIALDKYAESINEIMDIVRDLGRNSVSLDIQDEDLDVASMYFMRRFSFYCNLIAHDSIFDRAILGNSIHWENHGHELQEPSTSKVSTV